MDLAYGFMQTILEYPVAECGDPVVSLRDAVRESGAVAEFAESTIGGMPRQFVLRRGLIPGFLAVVRAMNDRGWVLRVEDGYRTTEMQARLVTQDYVFDVILGRVLWETGGDPPSPDLMFRRLTALTATIPKIGTHMSASAVDVSVRRMDDGQEVDRGGPYIELSEVTPIASPFISAAAGQNRREITAIFRAHGFVAYPYEFWHYSGGDAYDEYLRGSGRPARYGAVHVDGATGAVRPVSNPTAPLISSRDLQDRMARAMARQARGRTANRGDG
jgi:D-alanyl-D-alanine dipeptidase